MAIIKEYRLYTLPDLFGLAEGVDGWWRLAYHNAVRNALQYGWPEDWPQPVIEDIKLVLAHGGVKVARVHFDPATHATALEGVIEWPNDEPLRTRITRWIEDDTAFALVASSFLAQPRNVWYLRVRIFPNETKDETRYEILEAHYKQPNALETWRRFLQWAVRELTDIARHIIITDYQVRRSSEWLAMKIADEHGLLFFSNGEIAPKYL